MPTTPEIGFPCLLPQSSFVAAVGSPTVITVTTPVVDAARCTFACRNTGAVAVLSATMAFQVEPNDTVWGVESAVPAFVLAPDATGAKTFQARVAAVRFTFTMAAPGGELTLSGRGGPSSVVDDEAGADLPAPPSDVLVGDPSTFVVINALGIGDSISSTDARAALIDATTYTFASGAGVTLVNGSVGGSAAVVGGVLRLTCPAAPEARYVAGFLEAPYGQIAVPRDSSGRQPLRWRAMARVKSADPSAAAYLLAVSSGGSQRVGTVVGGAGTVIAEDNRGPYTYATLPAGTLPMDNTGYLEVEVGGRIATYRYGIGSPTQRPAVWLPIATADLPVAALFDSIRLVGATYSTDAAVRTVEFDELRFDVLT